MSRLHRMKQNHPLDVAIYHIEYVIETEGAKAGVTRHDIYFIFGCDHTLKLTLYVIKINFEVFLFYEKYIYRTSNERKLTYWQLSTIIFRNFQK